MVCLVVSGPPRLDSARRRTFMPSIKANVDTPSQLATIPFLGLAELACLLAFIASSPLCRRRSSRRAVVVSRQHKVGAYGLTGRHGVLTQAASGRRTQRQAGDVGNTRQV